MFDFAVTLTPDGNTVLVTFADVPEVLTFGAEAMLGHFLGDVVIDSRQAVSVDDQMRHAAEQMARDQIDGQHLASLPEARLAHYNRVLREQLVALQQALGECSAHLRMGMGLRQRELTPAVVDNALARDIQALRQVTRQNKQDIANLSNPSTRRNAIAGIDLPEDDDDGPDAFEAMLLMEALAGAPALRPARKKGRRR